LIVGDVFIERERAGKPLAVFGDEDIHAQDLSGSEPLKEHSQ